MLLSKVDHATKPEELLGLEGGIAAQYFEHFGEMLSFRRRSAKRGCNARLDGRTLRGRQAVGTGRRRADEQVADVKLPVVRERAVGDVAEDAKAEPTGIDHEIGGENPKLEADVVFTQGGEDASKHGGAPFSQGQRGKA